MGYCYGYTNRYDGIGYQKMMESLGNGGKILKKKKKQGSEEIRVDLSCCRYDILRIVIAKFGWEEVENNDDKGWHLCWTDTSIGPERLMSLRRGQKVNHFVGMLQICRKKSLARHLSTMRKLFPSLYKFSPRGYILPNQLSKFLTCFNISSPRTYILKPDNGCQGRGVVLVQSVSDVKQVLKGFPGADLLAQKYLTKPMLVNGYKFDLRIYVLILSCDSLRLYLYREGLVRFCTEKYNKPDRQNLKLSCMHLTNYAVNKKNCNFEFNVNASEVNKGNKWSLSALFDILAMQGFNVKELKRQIRKMVVLTIISIVPLLVHSYKTCLNEDDNGRSCFELLGMDVLLDDKCKPWLLEVVGQP
ncbi:hypothetical protein O6H91_14G005600 [Diphasiastrum complanatum]|uniref:Uncharacterized protein n=1 Tax=Diphasiastrum complanatum TaxID=34168 RepID=A0ACC2BL54_DIPCM|nr:hypothetical protein O6H91_14G005600 [Diphasiastrum complanatum]